MVALACVDSARLAPNICDRATSLIFGIDARFLRLSKDSERTEINFANAGHTIPDIVTDRLL